MLPYIDYKKLQESYGTKEKQYAKMVLKSLTEAAKKIYGNKIACRGRLDFVIVPGVIVSRETRNVCVVLLGLDLTSAGDHCSTDFLTKYGNVLQGHEADEQIQKFISEMYIPYQYTYTLPIIGDIHCLN